MQRQNKVWLDIVKYFKPYRNDDDVGPGCGAQIKPSVVGKFGNQDQAGDRQVVRTFQEARSQSLRHQYAAQLLAPAAVTSDGTRKSFQCGIH